MPSEVRVVVTVREQAIRDLARSPEMYDFLKNIVDEAAKAMRVGAPRKTGQGAASIHGEVHLGPDGYYGTASWTERRYYMGIQNKRRNFTDPAAAAIRYV